MAKRHYEKLFGTVWFDINRDTLFLDFSEGLPMEKSFAEDDLSIEDLKRVRFLASYAYPRVDDLQLIRLIARMTDLKRVFLSDRTPRRFPHIDYSDLVFTSMSRLLLLLWFTSRVTYSHVFSSRSPHPELQLR